MALGVMLVVAVLVVGHVVDNYFRTGAGLGYNLVIGKKGGEYQLVLNTVYYLGRPIENIPWSYYKEFLPASRRSDKTNGKFSPWVEKAVPCNLGDYYGSFRVVGTTPEMFGSLHNIPFQAGENFPENDFFTGVIGATVAKQYEMGVGDTFQPSHAAEDGHVHDEEFRVTGVLEHTGTPIDRALFVNIEGFFLLRGHALEGDPTQVGSGAQKHNHSTHSHAHGHDHHHHDHAHHEPLPEEQREVTSILVLTKSYEMLDPKTGRTLVVPPESTASQIIKAINKDVVAQVVQPIRVIYEFLTTFLRPLQLVLLGLTVMIVIVSAISILVSIYNSMAERRHEIAVMRALGAGRATVMRIMLLESVLLALVGGLIGWLVGHVILSSLSPLLTRFTGVAFPVLNFTSAELFLIPGIIALASLVGFLPAWSAYRTDVAKALTASP
jgi:putative ABC transport system permease protein